MFKSLFGNSVVEKILFFLNTYGEGYPLGMARTFGVPVNRIQQQLRRLENGGIVVSRMLGKVRLYNLNPGYPFLSELTNLLSKAFEFVPESEKDNYYRKHIRPGRPGEADVNLFRRV